MQLHVSKVLLCKSTYQQTFIYERHLHVSDTVLKPRASTCCVVRYIRVSTFLGKVFPLKKCGNIRVLLFYVCAVRVVYAYHVQVPFLMKSVPNRLQRNKSLAKPIWNYSVYCTASLSTTIFKLSFFLMI